MSKPSGFIFYKGPSMIDGAPIVAILTGLRSRSANSKTGGGLFQTWILREDKHPLDAINDGTDESICGDCKHRGQIVDGKNKNRTCYVSVFQAPANIWKSYKRGIYPDYSESILITNEDIRGGIVRGGSYGDPAAVPFYVWEALLNGLESGTAYTHQWARFPELASFAMASVDTSEEKAMAKLLGFRTFRVRAGGMNEEREVTCPASKEMGYKTTCDLCRACGGNSAKARADIVITVHGGKGKENAYERNANA